MSFCTNVCTYTRDPVRFRLRHLYQVEFCSFIVRYPTAGASVYCGHISSLLCFIVIPVLNANSIDPDLMPHSATSDLGLHCLPIMPFMGH